MKKQLISLLVLGLILMGCGGDSTEDETSGTTEMGSEQMPTETDNGEGEAGAESTGTMEGMESATTEETTEVTEEEGGESALEGSGYCASNPATEPGTLCASILMPEDAAGLPEKVSFHFFNVLPPMGPPTYMGLELALPSELEGFEPGAEVPMMMENLPGEGDLFLYAAVYMEGGGAQTWQLVPGIDYEGAADWETPITFTGEAINIVEPVQLLMAE